MTKRMLNRSLSLLLALVMCAGLLPVPARAASAPMFLGVTLSGASTAWGDSKNYVTAYYENELTVKQMFLAAPLAGNDGTTAVTPTLYLPHGSSTRHELVLYSKQMLDVNKLLINTEWSIADTDAGIRLMRHGSGEGLIYSYTASVTIPSSESVTVSSSDHVSVRYGSGSEAAEVARINIVRMSAPAPAPIVTGLEQFGVMENGGVLESFCVKLSGFSLPTAASAYQLKAYNGNATTLTCTGLTGPDANGNIELSFSASAGVDYRKNPWFDLYINGNVAYFLSSEHLSGSSFAPLPEGKTMYDSGYIANLPGVYGVEEHSATFNAPTVTLDKTTVDSPSFDATITDLGDYNGGSLTIYANGTELYEHWSGSQLTATDETPISIHVQLTDKQQEILGRGTYTLNFVFEQEGVDSAYVTATLSYAPAVTNPPYFLSASVREHYNESSITNAVVQKRGGAYLLSRKNDDDTASFIFTATPSADWLASLRAMYPYMEYYAANPLPVYLTFYDAVFENGTTTYRVISDGRLAMDWHDFCFAKTVPYSVLKDAEKAVVTCESFPGYAAATAQNPISIDIQLSLTTPEGYRAVTYAPSIPSHPVAITTTSGTGSEAVTQTTTVNVVNEGDNIECVVKVPSSDIGTGYGQTATLTYTIPGNSSPQTTTVDIGSVSGGEGKPTEIKADIPIPEGADTITGVTYTMTKPQEGGGTETVTTFDVPLPETGYRIGRPLKLTGIPAAYKGAVLTLTAPEGNPFAGYENTFTVPAPAGLCTVDCGNLPYGPYNYEIVGKSGFITRGSFTFSEENKVDGVPLTLPALYTLTVGVTAADANVLAYGGIPADVDLTLTVPDGKESGKAVKLTGALTSNGEIKVPGEAATDTPTDKTIDAVPAVFAQLPAGAVLTGAALRYDASAYPDVSHCDSGFDELTEEQRTLDADADLSSLFTFQPFSRHTITGTVVHPAGMNFGPHVVVVLTQNVPRNGGAANEVYTASTTVDWQNKFSFEVYDGVAGTLEFRSLVFGNQTKRFDAGSVERNIGECQLASIETTIRVDLNIQTPNPITRRGYKSYQTSASTTVPGDSGTLLVKKVQTYTLNGSKKEYHYYEPGQLIDGSKAFETMLIDGQLYVKVNAAAGTPSAVEFMNPIYYGDDEMTLINPTAYVGGYETPRVVTTAKLAGGELRAKVASEDGDETGFLCLVNKSRYTQIINGVNITPQTCTFVSGKGELHLPYTAAQVGDYWNAERSNVETEGALVFSLMCLDSDADAVKAMLESDLNTVLEKLDNGPGRQRERPFYRTILPANSYIYLNEYPENMVPWSTVGSEILPAYTFTYTASLGTDQNNKDSVLISGTLKKRLANMPDADVLRRVQVTTPGQRSSGFDSDTGNPTVEDINTNISFTINGSQIGNGTSYIWYGPQKSRVTEYNVSMVIPLDYYNRVNFSIVLTMGAPNRSETTTQVIAISDGVDIFSLSGPSEVSIEDQCAAQNKIHNKGSWELKLGLRATESKNPDENKVTIWDNGVAIKTYTVPKGQNTGDTVSGVKFNPGSYRAVWVRLTDNLAPGVHVLYASRVYMGNTIYTEPISFMLREKNDGSAGATGTPYVSDITWTHSNWKNNGVDTETMHFDNLSDLAGFTFWLWPSQAHIIKFKVNNVVSTDLESVTMVVENAKGNTRGIACHSLGNDYWGLGEKDDDRVLIPDLAGFHFEFKYKQGSLSQQIQNATTYQQRRQLELQQFCEANGLEVPDDAAYAKDTFNAKFNGSADGTIQHDLTEFANTVTGAANVNTLEAKGNFTAKTDGSGNRTGVSYSGTGDIRRLDVQTSETVITNNGKALTQAELWSLMAKEQENNLSDNQTREPANQGWRVYWAVTDDVNGYTFTRVAEQDLKPASVVYNGAADDYGGTYTAKTDQKLGSYFENSIGEKVYTSSDGLYHYKTRQTVWLPPAVNTALSDTNTTLFANPAGNVFDDDGRLAVRASLALAADPPKEDVEEEDSLARQGFDYLCDGQAVLDMGQDLYTGALKATYADWMLDGAKRGEEAVKDATFMHGWVGTTMNVLGTADTIYKFCKGPSGADPAALAAFANNIKDEGIRNSVQKQIEDYAHIRKAIFANDTAVNVTNTGAGWVDGLALPYKVALFVGSKINGAISDASKDYNRQAYNSILHLVCDQIQYERMKASIPEAEQQLRAKMDQIYGKGRWTERQFMQEKLNWVLRRGEDGLYRYVWKATAPKFNVYHDPAGYVFEATEDQRLQGVTATLYGSTAKDGDYSVWQDTNADESARQANPLTTDAEGVYRWMVPSGWWKVQYRKDGYLDAESIEMEVPPAHTAVNVGMLSTEAPKASVSVGTTDITVMFSKYMQMESLLNLYGEDAVYTADTYDASVFKVRFYGADGAALEGTVSFPDKVENTGYKGTGYGRDVIASDWFVKTAVFTPDAGQTITGTKYALANGMVSYAGVALDKVNAASLVMVSFDANGGTYTLPDQVIASGGTATLYDAVRDGYEFTGWYTAKTNGQKIEVSQAFDESTSLYAHWEKITAAAPEPLGTGNLRVGEVLDDQGNGTGRMGATVFAGADALGGVLMLAAYDMEGRLIKVVTKTITSAEIDTETGDISIEMPANKDIALVSAFVLNKDYVPLVGKQSR